MSLDQEGNHALETAVNLHRAGKFTEAEAAYREIVAKNPHDTRAHLNVCICLMDAQRWADAERQLESFVAAHPESATGWVNLGIVLRRRGASESAESAFRRAVDANPNFAEAHNNLGAALRARGEFDAAMNAFKKAVELAPTLQSAQMNVGFGEFLRGNLPGGWAAHELRLNHYPRLQDSVFANRVRWHSEIPLTGKTLCVTAEQGLGDTLQFVRYLPILAARGGRIVLAVQRPLVSILQGFPGVAQVFSEGDRMPAFDYYCPLLSIPFELGTTLESIPPVTPIKLDPQLAAGWKHRLSRSSGTRRVGVVWSGNPQHQNDLNRSIPLATFARLFTSLPDVQFYSLQKDPPQADIATLPEFANVVNLGPDFRDFADTAAAIAGLDLVISVDTSVAHLAGTMNKPVWILLPFSPDWRWMLDRDDTPWYPSAALFRQTTVGDWSDPLGQIIDQLE